jgi:hypothetical protein
MDQSVCENSCFIFGIPNKILPESRIQMEEPKMDIAKMLADLRQQRQQIEAAIVSLERVTLGGGRRRGRPPAWMTAIKRKGRPPGNKNKRQEAASA